MYICVCTNTYIHIYKYMCLYVYIYSIQIYIYIYTCKNNSIWYSELHARELELTIIQQNIYSYYLCNYSS